jgi:hypothetical protein
MSGIPIYTSSPVKPPTASKPTGVTPQTALPPNQSFQTPSKPSRTPASPTTAAAPSVPTPYAPAQPGAAAVPVPTQAPQPLQSTPTSTIPTSTTSYGPPPPQPGAVPTILQPTTAQKPSIPPPPKAGEKVQSLEFYAPVSAPTSSQAGGHPEFTPQSMPPQWQQQLPNPPRAQPPASTSSAFETGRASLEHPPGYIQNPNAAADDVFNPPVRALEGLVGSGGDSSLTGDEPGVWDTAKKWALDAAGKVGEMEKEVWRRINREEK